MSRFRKQILCAALSLTMLALCAGCQGEGNGGAAALLSLSFDEGSGNQVKDSAGQIRPGPSRRVPRRPHLAGGG